MKSTRHILALLMFALAAAGANAQFVKGSEAVTYSSSGTKRVETPPIPSSAARLKPCAATAGCYGGAWLMVETLSGLVECTEPYARPTACRSSTYGNVRRMRIWVVKVSGKWMACQLPDLKSQCVYMFARPPANLVVAIGQ